MSSTTSINALTRMGATVKDLFIQLYDLSPPELDILLMLISKENEPPMTIEQISQKQWIEIKVQHLGYCKTGNDRIVS
jgi:predicted transcriptional regulator